MEKMLEKLRNSKRIALLPILALTLAVASFTAPAHAYGPAQWQAGFSGNFSNKVADMRAGFWGWCEFGQSAADGQSGTEADCQVTTYMFNGVGASTGGLFHQSIHGTKWIMLPTTMGPPLPGLPADDFFITDGTMTITGPLVVKIVTPSGIPPPPGCTLSGQSATCPIPVWETIPPGCTPGVNCLYSSDTGIPAAPGHYSFANILEAIGIEVPPGTHVDIQVNQIAH
jgi:hypothetical protein